LQNELACDVVGPDPCGYDLTVKHAKRCALLKLYKIKPVQGDIHTQARQSLAEQIGRVLVGIAQLIAKFLLWEAFKLTLCTQASSYMCIKTERKKGRNGAICIA